MVAIGDRDLRRAQQAIVDSNLDQATAYGSYGEVLDDPLVRAVYIPLSTGLHREWVLKAAAKGLHVVCEKPVALVRS